LSRLLVLGGSAFQLPAIQRARELGHHVVTCDYLPENPGHRYAHEYHNVSTTDVDGVLAVAKASGVDGALAFASDPAAWTASCVASDLNLPGNSPEAVQILCNKPAFRTWLRSHGFRAPRFAAPSSVDEAVDAVRELGLPVMVKPCDSSGSKGVHRVTNMEALAAAYASARSHSRSNSVIVEEWVERRGPQIAGDGLVLNGQLVFGCFGDEHFDAACCAHAPVGESFPGHLATEGRDRLYAELQRMFTALGIRNLVFNLDAMIDAQGNVMFIEIGPRAGGNCLPQVIRNYTGVDLTDIAIRLALGEDVPPQLYRSAERGFHASWIVHSPADGLLASYSVDPSIRDRIRDLEFLVAPGSQVRKFVSSAETLGYAVLTFPTALEMERELAHMSSLLRPVLA
jgi:biotin carboxylase